MTEGRSVILAFQDLLEAPVWTGSQRHIYARSLLLIHEMHSLIINAPCCCFQGECMWLCLCEGKHHFRTQYGENTGTECQRGLNIILQMFTKRSQMTAFLLAAL